MTKALFVLLFLISINHHVPAQQSDAVCFEQAYSEIAAMLDGKTPLSIKRAVFLAEWAYQEGTLDYNHYCRSIDRVVIFIRKFMDVNQTDKYKTGKNLALTEYFFNPYSGNNYTPFTYDFEGDTDDITKSFVTYVIQTHKGQCRSLPMYYRVLAEAVGAEASIAFAPLHVFIRYRNEDNLFPEPWVNVELTTHQIQPEFWIKENFEITDKALASKMYLHPLSAKETVAYQLSEMAFWYWHKYRRYDDFTLKCTEKSLQYYAQDPKALIIMGHSYNTMLDKHHRMNGGCTDQQTRFYEKKLMDISHRLDSIGWQPMTEHLYKKLEDGNKQGKDLQTRTAELK